MFTNNNETENRVMNTMAELDAAYAAQTQQLRMESTQRYEDFRLQLQPVHNERSVRMAEFHRTIAALQAKVADLQRTIAEEECRMAEFKAASIERSTQLEEAYHRFTTDVCHRKLQLKQWFEKEHERLREAQK